MDWGLLGLGLMTLVMVVEAGWLVAVHLRARKTTERAMNLPEYRRTVIAPDPRPDPPAPAEIVQRVRRQQFQPENRTADITPISPFSPENGKNHEK